MTFNKKLDCTKANIMIVDDDPINIEVVQTFLEDEGYRNFVTLVDSTKAFDVVQQARPDLLFLDLSMPEVSGFDILAKLRSLDKFRYLPIIILTAATDKESKLRALELGATDFLAKPLDPSELGLRVRNTLYAKAYQDQLAYYDPLTKLPNRQLFLEELEWMLKVALRHQDKLALLNIEIDKFAKVNDTIGMGAGDEVLRIVTERIQRVVRDLDVLGRAMGDEETEMKLFHLDNCVFTLLLNRLQNPESTAHIAERIIKEIKRPICVEERQIYVTASVGIATFPTESRELPTLIKLSSSAKDFVKKNGGDNFQFSSESISKVYEKRQRMESLLREAVASNSFVLHYQPKVDMQTNQILGVESLIRMQHPKGLIYPAEFIALAEETGLIIQIGKWVLTESCRQLREWHESGRQKINLSVNLSAKQFIDQDFMESVKKIIVSSGVDTSYLTLELTESLLLEDIEEKIKILHQLKALGLTLSIDDFGTGYSSLSYLRKLPVDELKIDRSFVMEIPQYEDSRAVVSSIIFLAKSLKLKTVAEGIEEETERVFLKEKGCEQMQGFLFSRPLPADQLLSLLTMEPAQVSEG